MKNFTLATTLAVLVVILFAVLSSPGPCSAETLDLDSYQIAIEGVNTIQNSEGLIGSAKAAADSFYIYGGPGTAEGRFQTLPYSPGGAPDTQGWIGVDLTEQTPRWHAGTTNAESAADGNPAGFSGGVGNQAALSYHEGADYVGYGNSWNDWFVFTYDVTAGNPGFNPAVDVTTVRFTCEYKHFTEELYDFLHFEWNQGGAYQTLIAVDGTSYNDSTGYYEKRDFDSDAWGGITYNPGDYIDGTKIELRIRVTSDGGWSDEDELFSSQGFGAAAIDNITVYTNGAVVSVADFDPLSAKIDLPEGDFTGMNVGAGSGTTGWASTPSSFVGDFSKIFGSFQEPDLCRDNISPQFSFINDGTTPNNAVPGTTIAPAISPTWTYGIPGGYVVDFNGGLTNGLAALTNQIWSPEISWDLPGTEDDVSNGGAVLGYSRFTHLPLTNGIFAVWHVRSFDGSDWTGWESNNFVYYGASPAYGNFTVDVTAFLVQNPERVQIALGTVDFAETFAFAGNDATPAPLYDNVYLKKYEIGGPAISTRTIDLASDCFPIDGTLSGSCRFDASIGRNQYVLVPGDSIVAEIKAIIPGSALTSPLTGGDLVVRQLVNPDFAGARAAGVAAVGATLVPGPDAWDVYEYRVIGQQVTGNTGDVVADRYFWDLPDGLTNGLPHISTENALLFPGDVVHYYLEASDDLGNTSTLPGDTVGFGDFSEGNLYNRIYVLRMLPTLQGGDQPAILFWNDFGHRGGENEYLQAFRQNGLVEGVDYDTYTTKGPSSGVGNGLGSAGYHGANAGQLAGYDAMIYVCGNLISTSISDGSGDGDNDLSADLATLEAWANADADRYHAYFGDSFAQSMVAQGAACQSYLNNGLGVDLLGNDVGPAIDNQTAATLAPTGSGSGAYVGNYVAYGGCLVINDFDELGAFGVGPVLAHEFTDANGDPYGTTVAGSVEWSRLDGNSNTKHTIVFPYDLLYVRNALGDPGTGLSARAELLDQVLRSWGLGGGGIPPGTGDVPTKLLAYQNYPNPFNPRTTIKFAMPARGQVSVKVYNVRGELVTTLFDGFKDAGEQSVIWSGQDGNGAQVSTGIYLYKVEADGQEVIKKMALLR